MNLSSRIPELDGIRGIAVLLVIVYHAVLYNPGSTDEASAAVELFGHAGVDLFFVLSGFLITGILLKSKGRPGYFRNFYAKRALRIWPLYYLLLAVAFVIVPLLAHYAHLASGENANIQARNVFIYIFLLQNLFYSLPFSPTLLAMTWSLAIEEQFYILWPSLVLLFTRKRLTYILGYLVILTPLLRLWALHHGLDFEAIYRITWFRLDSLSLGAILSLWYLADFVSVPDLKSVALMALAVGMLGRPLSPPWMEDSLLSLACFGAVLFAIWCNASHSVTGILFRWRWLRYIGTVSYCLYLVHQPMYYACSGLAKKYLPSGIAADTTVAALGFFASLALASLSWHFFESPILSLKQKIEEAPRS
jgi:peptidoglycan/LPS O-acetylase OafA/YrhL